MKNPFHQIRNFYLYTRAFGIRGAIDVLRGWRQADNLFSVRVKFCGESLWVRRDRTDFVILLHSAIFRSGFVPEGFRPKVVLDIGANVGITTAIFAARWPEAQIIAVEPEPHNFEMLEKNCKHFPNVKALQAAIWVRDEALSIKNPDAPAFGYQVGEATNHRSDTEQQIDVPGISIPTLMREYNLDNLDFVKIDIESGEKTLFGSETASWLPHVRILAVELHDFMEPGCSDTVFQAVEPYHPTHFPLDEYEVFHFPEHPTNLDVD